MTYISGLLFFLRDPCLFIDRKKGRDTLTDMVKVFIIGAGDGGEAVLSRLLQFNWFEIVGVADLNPDAPAIHLARAANVPVFLEDPLCLLQKMSIDLVFDLTRNPVIGHQLIQISENNFDVATGEVAHVLWDMIRELEDRETRIKQRLGENQVLLEVSMILSRSETPDEIFQAIVAGAMRITGMPAGSLSVYNKHNHELFLVATKGLSSDFYKNGAYPVRPGGLTEHILSNKDPILIPDLADFPAFDNPVILKEGIRSLIALPLISDKGPIGILYNDDFQPRRFQPTLTESLKMLSTQAVIAIQKQQAFEQIKDLSIRDPLTGLYNRRYLNKVLASEMGRAQRLNRALSLVLFDIDKFKRINDTYGHAMGDQVLQALAECFELIIRPYDVLSRFGGEEFLILMSETDEAKAISSAERLRTAAAALDLLPDGDRVTCSFGVCTLERIGKKTITPKEFIQCADHALYRAKNGGRNRVCIYEN